MALDSSALVGSMQLAGAKVNPLGTTSAIAGASSAGGDLASNVVADVVDASIFARRRARERAHVAVSTAPDFGRLGFLAVTAEELILIGMTAPTGTSAARLGAVLVRVDRREVRSADLKRSMLYASPLTITFADKTAWLLEVPRLARRSAQRVVQALSSPALS
jgi:hypothetical protein